MEQENANEHIKIFEDIKNGKLPEELINATDPDYIPASEIYHLNQRAGIGVIINYTYSYRDITISINIALIQPED